MDGMTSGSSHQYYLPAGYREIREIREERENRDEFVFDSVFI